MSDNPQRLIGKESVMTEVNRLVNLNVSSILVHV